MLRNFFLGGIPYLLTDFQSGTTNGDSDASAYRSVLTDTSNSNLITDVYFTEYAFSNERVLVSQKGFGTYASLFNFEVRFSIY